MTDDELIALGNTLADKLGGVWVCDENLDIAYKTLRVYNDDLDISLWILGMGEEPLFQVVDLKTADCTEVYEKPEDALYGACQYLEEAEIAIECRRLAVRKYARRLRSDDR